MKRLAYKAATAVTTATLLLGSLAPVVFADTTVEISGNGADSQNTANVAVTNSTVVTQNNSANIQNDVNVNSNSGNNEANRNTGGDVSIDTGDANADVNVSNTANSNVADVQGCCLGDITATISGNGADSDNDLNLASQAQTFVTQNNSAEIKNDVYVGTDTGNNEANRNTGGDVSINTGTANSGVTIDNKANKNIAQVGGGNGGSVWVEISGNGSDSYNTANVALAHAVTVTQNNWANIQNDVDVSANSGNNEANRNTGGDVSIDTGDANADVDIDNLANFNAADVDNCGCLVDLTVRIKENGADSDNDANVALVNALFVDQYNKFSCDKLNNNHEGWGEWFGWGRHDDKDCNDVDVYTDTGNNEANRNTDGGDPSVDTGTADADVSVDTTVNSNVVGNVDLGDIEIPDVDVPGDLSGLLVLLLGLFG